MKPLINADPQGKITLQGYDPVAFHTVGKALKGNPSIMAEYHGYHYLFASEENKTIFEKEPEKYLPAYGGYCAYGATLGVFFPVEIDTWEIIDDRLVLQFSQDIKQRFNEHRDENIQKANDHWSKME
jgi:YHS domain-containing protein